MNIYFSSRFIKKSKQLIKKDKSLKDSLDTQISLFITNPNHPSLKLHKLKGKRSKQLAIWIKGDLRTLCIKNVNDLIFIDLIKHDEY